MASTPFASPLELADRWRDLSDDETRRACVLLEDASQMIRDAYPDVDERVSTGQLAALTPKRIVCAMVQRAMLPGANGVEGVSAQTQVVGPFQVQNTFSSPVGSLYLSGAEISALEPPTPQRKRAFAVDLDPGRQLPWSGWSAYGRPY